MAYPYQSSHYAEKPEDDITAGGLSATPDLIMLVASPKSEWTNYGSNNIPTSASRKAGCSRLNSPGGQDQY